MKKEAISKRIKSKGLHEWSKNDTILALYYAKYGVKNLYLNTGKKLASFIGSSIASLEMQSANIRYLMGDKERTLTDYSELQKEVFDEFNDKPWYNLYTEVKNIIGQDEHERNQALIKMGKDPSKMKMVEKN